MTFVTMTVVDKIGRRSLLIISAVVMGLSSMGLAGYFVMEKTSATDLLPLGLIIIYISAFSLGFGPVPWVVMGEIFSAEVSLIFVNYNTIFKILFVTTKNFENCFFYI